MLLTKIIPPTSARRLLERPRLHARFTELERTRLTLVRTPAGFGKTSLLWAWFAELQRRGHLVAWLSLDSEDGDPLALLAYVVLALESSGYRFGAAVTSLVGTDSFASVDAIVGAIVNDLCRSAQPVFLFLDDVHVLTDAATSGALVSLIEHAPAALHVVVASREVLPLPLARARAIGVLTEFNVSDLCFSRLETAQYMASNGADLDDAHLALLDGRVEGWVAGLKLAAIALDNDKRGLDALGSVSGRLWTFADFFAEVVTRQLSSELRDFLLATSVLDRFCPELCDAVTTTAGSRAFIDEIEARGLFIFSLDGERKWYRYHHLFAEFLNAELGRRGTGLQLELHGRASRWLATAGFDGEAFSHAVRAGDFTFAAHILDQRCHRLFYDGQIRRLLDDAAQIPVTILRTYPRIELARAWSLILQWKFYEARTILTAVKDVSGDVLSPDSGAGVHQLYLHCTMMLAQFEDDMPTVERQCVTLLERFMEADPYLVGTYYASLLYAEREQYNLRNFKRHEAIARDYFARSGSRFVLVWHQSIAGPTRLLAGDTAGAIAALTEGLDAATAIGGAYSPLAAIPALLLAGVYYERNETQVARELTAAYLDVALALGFVDQLVAGFITASRLQRLDGDVEAAERTLERGMTIAHTRGFRRLEWNIVAEGMTQALRAGARDRLERLASQHDLAVGLDALLPAAGTTTGTEARAIAWTAIARAQGQTDEALHLAKAWLQFTESAGAIRSAVQWAIMTAEMLLAKGDARHAGRAARRAAQLAAPGRFVRAFLDLGSVLSQLLTGSEATRGDGLAPGDAFLRELLALSASPDAVCASGEVLNLREVEIVKLAASGMSNRDIAERIATTEGTVKWYLHQIFEKLGARRRTQAIEVARRAGLLN